MKKYILIFLLLLINFLCFAQRQVMVDKDGKLVYPPAPVFIDKNDIASLDELNSRIGSVEGSVADEFKKLEDTLYSEVNKLEKLTPYYRFIVDCSPSTSFLNGEKIDFNTSDCELKVMPNSYLADYWFSTLGQERSNLYLTYPKRDVGANVWFTCPDIGLNPLMPDSRHWIQRFPDFWDTTAEQARDMCLVDYIPVISSFAIEPNVDGKFFDGTNVNSIFASTPKAVKPVIMRISPLGFERTKSGSLIWRIPNLYRLSEPTPTLHFEMLKYIVSWTPTSGISTSLGVINVTSDVLSSEGIFVASAVDVFSEYGISFVSFDVEFPNRTWTGLAQIEAGIYNRTNRVVPYTIHLGVSTPSRTESYYAGEYDWGVPTHNQTITSSYDFRYILASNAIEAKGTAHVSGCARPKDNINNVQVYGFYSGHYHYTYYYDLSPSSYKRLGFWIRNVPSGTKIKNVKIITIMDL